MTKRVKINGKIMFSRMNSNAGDHVLIPKIKIADNKIEKINVVVRHELIISCLLVSLGKNRVMPKVNPNSENATNKFAAEISAVTSPTSCCVQYRATSIQKTKPNRELTTMPTIRKYEFLNSGSFRWCFNSFVFFGIMSPMNFPQDAYTMLCGMIKLFSH